MNERIPPQELELRLENIRKNLLKIQPDAGGIMIFSRLNIYYLTGSFINGLLWIPTEGAPLLLCKKGIERAELEGCPYQMHLMNSFRQVHDILGIYHQKLPEIVAAEFNGLSWGLSQSLTKYLSTTSFVSADAIIGRTRSVKSHYEIGFIKEAGINHNLCLTELLPAQLQRGMSEFDVGKKTLDLFLENGHQAILRMEKFGEEIFFGHIAIGDSANYPSVYNGPVGLRGIHPAAPFMGSPHVQWQQDNLLTIDNGFSVCGYQTDKTNIYWLGNRKSIPANVQKGHDFCLMIQDYIAKAMVPGAIPSEIYRHCIKLAKSQNMDDGFMGLGNNKVGFIGHGIGLAVDESPVIADRFNMPLEENMVVAVEPKYGIEGIGMVGIENTFLIEKDGAHSLTGNEYDIICIDNI